MAQFQPGETFAGHRIEGLAGRGGMGEVYRATELRLDRVVALKLIAPQLAGDEEFRERFLRESRAAASIEHPNVIPIYYAGERDGLLYIAMRYVDGQDLRTHVRAAGRLAPGDAAQVVSQVAAGLDAAHARGLVHRDVKPANVLLDREGHAYLTDFGLAKRPEATTAGFSRSGDGAWVGTLGYVAPEQIRGARVDARTDVYALGCVLVHALTGRPPYVREGDEATLWAHLHDPPPGPAEGVPGAFAPVLARALAKDPAERFPSAGDLGRAALTAAGVAGAPQPERVVARGDAAPDETRPTTVLADAETAVTPGGEAPTAVPSGSRASTAVAPARPARSAARRLAPLLGVAAVLAAGGAAAAALLGDGDGGGGGGDTASTAPSRPDDAAVELTRTAEASTVRLAERPGAIAVAGGAVWVTDGESTRVARFDAQTGRRLRSSASIPAGTRAMTTDGRSVWLVNEPENLLLRLDARTGRVTARRDLLPGNPYAVGVDRNAVWVGSRASRSRFPQHRVLRVDRRSGGMKPTVIEHGMRSLAVGADAVWVTPTRGSEVTRLDKRTGDTSTVRAGEEPKGVAVGAGAVWVANSGGSTVTQIDPRTMDRITVDVGPAPQLIATAGDAVYVTVQNSSRLVRLQRDATEPVATVATAANPYALATTGADVWVTSPARGLVQRFSRARAG
jgi:DNA-binding beta-propeller fold protein YncE